MTTTVADDSHNHVISNIDGLQSALGGKLSSSGGTITGTLTLSKTTDASGTANNSPALIIGGTATTGHIEIDNNEILCKSDDTTPTILSLNTDGGQVKVGSGGFRSVGEATFDETVTSEGGFVGNLTGNASTATKLQTTRTITLAGDLSGSVSFDGSRNVTLTGTVNDDSHNHTIANVDNLQSTLDGKVPTSRTINDKALSSNITLTASDLGAIPYDNNRIEIPENADLNDYTTVGAYRCGYNAYAATLANSPITSGFIMDVVSGVGLNNAIGDSNWSCIVQRLYGYKGEIYTRRIEKESASSTPTYYDWVKTYTTSAKPTPSEIGAATSNHTHTIANIDNLQTTLNGKANTSHTHNYAGSSSAGGVANSASKLATARTITLDGNVTGSASFDGSKNITITTKGVGEREHDMNTDGCYFEADLTASTYDQNTWYPIVGSQLPTGGYTKISCNVQLDNTSHPTWGTHGSGFVCNFTIYAKAAGWGTTGGESYVTDWFYNWCAKNPLGYQQMSNSSRPVIFARGGGLYPIRSSEPITWTVYSTTFTDDQQSVSPTTTEPSITFNGATIHAHLSGNVVGNVTGNATTATTATKASTGSLNRVTHSYNEVPSVTTYRWEEFSNSAANAPTAHWYHTFTGRGYDSAYATQLALGMTTNTVAYRRMDANYWHDWQYFLTSYNYNTYVPSLTGSGASGTWNINVTGTASTATYAHGANEASYANRINLPRQYSQGDYNEDLPGAGRISWREFTTGSVNGPGNYFYHVFTGHSADTNFYTQLALGMTTDHIAYRRVDFGNSSGWHSVITDKNYGSYTEKSHPMTFFYSSEYSTYADAIFAKKAEGYTSGILCADGWHPTDMPALGNWSTVWWRCSCGHSIYSIQLYIDRDPNIWLGTLASGENNNQITWGKVYTTRSGTFSGNATSATQLQTARTINGTSFNGTANITTANWGTARTIKIGNTGKSVNGSNNVTWSLSEIGAAASSHTHPASQITAGALPVGVTATNSTDYTTSRVRNARFGTSAPSSLANGEIFFVYE